MPLNEPSHAMTLPEFIIVCAISTLAGVVIGLPLFAASQLRGTPILEMLFLVVISVPLALGISLLFALVGAPIGAICMLILRSRMPQAARRTWMLAGAAVGAFIGALHPFVVLFAVTDRLMGNASLGNSLPLAASIGACGSFSGCLVGWWYRDRVLRSDAQASSAG